MVVQTQSCTMLSTYNTSRPDIDHICKQRTMWIVQCILHRITTKIFNPGSWKALVEWFSSAGCTYNKAFGEYVLISPAHTPGLPGSQFQFSHSSVQKKTIYFMNVWGGGEEGTELSHTCSSTIASHQPLGLEEFQHLTGVTYKVQSASDGVVHHRYSWKSLEVAPYKTQC